MKPLSLGTLTFPNNIIQGPLAGVSCSPFRYQSWKYSKPAFNCTEMISCKTLIYQSKTAHNRFVHIHPQEGPVCFQLSANNEKDLAEGVKIATQYGADLIDLNCGCPVKKIRGKKAGSSLLSDPKKLYDLMIAMKQSTHVPVSIKIRVDGDSSDNFNREIAKVVSEAGVDFLVVHGRHWTENYDSPCRYNEIAFFVNELKIPVIGNGDVKCIASLQKMLSTGCAGVMIARAGMGQPWLINKLISEIKNTSPPIISLSERGEIFFQHIEALAALLESDTFALIQARKFSKYYARDLVERVIFCEAINQCDSMSSFKKTLHKFFS